MWPSRVATATLTLSVLLGLSLPTAVRADPVPVVNSLGTEHGFLTLRTLEGKLLATGDLVQVGRGTRVTNRLIFHFRDGSLYQETTVFTQRKTFQFVSDRLIMRGPSFPTASDAELLANGDFTMRTLEKGEKRGEGKVVKSHFDLPPDISNGMIFSLLTSLSRKIAETKIAMLAETGKGRLVHLSIKPDGEDSFTVDGERRQATIFRIHVEIGGIAGVVAPIIGKQPDDIRAWIVEDGAAALVKVEGQLFEGGPVWRMEMTAPVWGGR